MRDHHLLPFSPDSVPTPSFTLVLTLVSPDGRSENSTEAEEPTMHCTCAVPLR